MQRDMELVRSILIAVENYNEPNRPVKIASLLGDYPEDQINYNTNLLYQSGFIDGYERKPTDGTYILVTGLTWEGHEFLDAIRNETIWNQTKEVVKEKGGSLPFEIIKTLAVEVAKKMVGL